jgi:hypothetical protein
MTNYLEVYMKAFGTMRPVEFMEDSDICPRKYAERFTEIFQRVGMKGCATDWE